MRLSFITALLCAFVIVAPGFSQQVKPDAPPGDSGDPNGQKPPQQVKPTTPDAEDVKLLHKVGVDADGKALLTYFRERTYNEADPKKMETWISHLASDVFQVREIAYGKIQGLGPAAAVGLKNARNHPDIEVRKRVAVLLKQIQEKANASIQTAAARVVAVLKPKDGAEVLLKFLPYADKDAVDEIIESLGNLAVINGQADPVLVNALQDKSALKRAAAGEALAKAKAKQHWSNIKKLLQDKDPDVRYRVALALAYSDKESIPVLIDLIAEYPADKLWEAESLLVRLAGDKTPAVSIGADQASRKAARDAWRKWYDGAKDKIDLAKLTKTTTLGYTLLMHQVPYRIVNGKRIRGGVMELGRDKKKIRFKFNLDTYPVDGQVIGHNKVLLAEYQFGRVTIRDFKGNITWQYAVGGNPLGVQVLPNGNIFVTTRNRLLELDRNKKIVFDYQQPGSNIYRGHKLPNGEVIFVTNSGQLTRMNPKTRKAIKTFYVGTISYIYGSIAFTNKGEIVVPLYNNNQVAIFDKNGKRIRTMSVSRPTSVAALANGHFLVTSVTSQRVYEYDRAGRQVWSYAPGGMVYNVHRR